MKPAPATTATAALIALTIAAAPNSAIAQCEGGKWSDAFPAPFYLEDQLIRQSAMLDPDGDGPEPARLALFGEVITGSGAVTGAFDPFASVQVWDGPELRPFSATKRINCPGAGAANRGRVLMYDQDGPNGPVPPRVHIVGRVSLRSADGTNMNRVAARLVGDQWEDLPFPNVAGYSDAVVYDPDGSGPELPALFASRTSAITKWDGSTATTMSQADAPGTCLALAAADPDGPGPRPHCLIAMGDFIPTMRAVHLWDGTNWTRLPGEFQAWAEAIVVFDPDGPAGPEPDRLVLGGQVGSINGISNSSRIVEWRDGQWQAIGGGINAGRVTSLAVFDEDGDGPNPPLLFVGGEDMTVAGIPATPLLKWNGSEWFNAAQANGDQLTRSVWHLNVADEDESGPQPLALHITGDIELRRPDGERLHAYARWDGASWHSPRREIDSWVVASTALPAPNDTEAQVLVVGGEFDRIGQLPASRVAMWDGHAWSPLGDGFDDVVHSLISFDVDGPGPMPVTVVAAGDFTASGSTPLDRVAYWSGTEWLPLGTGLNADSPSLSVFDLDGPGPMPARLLLAGVIFQSGMPPVCRVLEWDGVDWTTLGNALTFSTPSLVLGECAVQPHIVDGAFVPLLLAPGELALPPENGGPCKFAYWENGAWNALPGAGSGMCDWPQYEPRIGVNLVSPVEPAIGLAPGDLLYSGVQLQFDTTNTPRAFQVSSGLHASANLPTLVPSPTFPLVTVGALGLFDEDGPGPLLPYAIAGTMDWSSGAHPTLFRWAGVEWEPMNGPTETSYAGGFTSVDYDGEGPNPPRLVVRHGQFITSNGQTRVGFLREWVPSVPATLIESPHSLIVRPGDPASFKVLAVGTDASINWRKDNALLPEGAHATEHSWIITIDSATTDDRGLYDAVITNMCAEVASDGAELRVRVLEGDANADTVVDFADITNTLAHWGADYAEATGPGDADSDGAVTMNDLTATLKNWLATEE